MLDYKSFKAKVENLGISTDVDEYHITPEQKTRRLYAFGVKKSPLMAGGQ